MSIALASTQFSLPASPFPPLAVGFFGLGTGYLIYGTQELFNYPRRDERVDLATGIWGVWMPGFMQFLTGIYLFAGLTLFGTFTSARRYTWPRWPSPRTACTGSRSAGSGCAAPTPGPTSA